MLVGGHCYFFQKEYQKKQRLCALVNVYLECHKFGHNWCVMPIFHAILCSLLQKAIVDHQQIALATCFSLQIVARDAQIGAIVGA